MFNNCEIFSSCFMSKMKSNKLEILKYCIGNFYINQPSANNF